MPQSGLQHRHCLALLAGLALVASACGSSSKPEEQQAPTAQCDPTMDWKPRSFGAGVFYVDGKATAPGQGTKTEPWSDLQFAIDSAPDGAELLLSPGTYSAKAAAYTDPTCGNCAPDKQHSVSATRGFVIGKSLAIRGGTPGDTILQTNAGYGVLVEDACEVFIADLAITGGTRDADGDAADGAVVVRRSRLTLSNVAVRSNSKLMPGDKYPGITGVMLRAGADVLMLQSDVHNNSWDGVSIYDDGKLRMYGSKVRDGNGVGVGVTWNGRALLVNNDISGYWKGVGAFVDAQVDLRNNTIHHNVGWGVWVNQRSRMDLTNNTIAYNDLLGASLNGDEIKGSFVNNLVAFNGLFREGRYPEDTFGGRMGVRGAAPEEHGVFAPAYNVVWHNQVNDWIKSDGATPADMTRLGSNFTADPKFASETKLVVGTGSTLVDAGDPNILDADGSRSDLGATGGPLAGAVGP